MMQRACVSGVAHYLPDTVVSSEDVEFRVHQRSGFRIPRGLITRVTGVESRQYRAAAEQCSDLAVQAARTALQRAAVAATDVDVLIFASCTQDLTEPATANIVQDKLAATQAHAIDVKNACNSFLNALDIADGLVRAGKAKKVLVTVGETPSLGIDWNVDSAEKLRAGIAGLTLGDAGGAAVVQAAPKDTERGIITSAFRTFGDKWRLATVLGGGSMHGFDPQYASFSGKPRVLREQAYKHIPTVVDKVLKAVGWTPDDIDVVCCHQITTELIDAVAAKCHVDRDKCMVSIKDCGNTAAASIPIGLSRAFEAGLLEPGKQVLLVGAAAGFSVGAIPMIW
ncbi:MAG: 3-oxoacyl-ACP synthase III family protein [Planctomycetota bacterium]|jgi:3-oxoacyl-[acyl-carrier-protein] synthase-3